MAGAVPQVLASAALTRSFDLRDEVEFTDELDNKPDDERTPVTTSVQLYLEDVEYFLLSLSRLVDNGKLDLKRDTLNLAQATLLPCVENSRAGRYRPIRFDSSREEAKAPLAYLSRGMVYGYSLGDCVANIEFNGVAAVDSVFELKLDKIGFTIDLAVKKQSPQNARDLVDLLNGSLELYSGRENTKLRQHIIERTRFSFQNDLVFLRFHLARSDLESLLVSVART